MTAPRSLRKGRHAARIDAAIVWFFIIVGFGVLYGCAAIGANR